MRCTILLLFILSLGVSDLAAQNRRLRQPAAVVEVSAPVFSWEEAFGPEKMLDPKSVCAPYFNFGPHVKACPFDKGVTLLQTPLAGVRGFLTWCGDEGPEPYWCVWRRLQLGQIQWLTSLLPDRRLVREDGSLNLLVTARVGYAAGEGTGAAAAARPARLSRDPAFQEAEGRLTQRSAAPVFPAEQDRKEFSMETITANLVVSRFVARVSAEGARYEMDRGRALVVEGGQLRLKEGTTVLKSWPVFPESVVVRYGDGHVEVHTRFARLNTK